jgi:DNA-binding IclR family transcriptional regulator
MGSNSSTRVRTLERALRIVQALQEMDGGTVTEVANRVDLPKSTVHNHLQTLLANEYVTRHDDEYVVSLRFLELGGYTRDRMNVFQVAKPEIKGLAEETGELANLLVEEHGLGIYLYREQGEDAVELDSYAGKRQYLHSTAFGKAMLAFMPDGRVESILDRHGLPARTDRTITDRGELFDELEEIRDRGYSYDDEESLKGLRCIAAPIQNDDRVVGAVSVSGPVSRLSGERFSEELPDMLLSTTNIIEINLTYT